jgi:hypothetical protein
VALAVRVERETVTARISSGALTGYASGVQTIAAIMVGELGLPLPSQFAVFVYPAQDEYAQGLVQVGHVSPARAAEIAERSVGLARPGRLLLNDHALRGARRSTWLGVVAHELTHLAQYELSGGRRGSSVQWVREGMADWVKSRVLERLGEGTFRQRRQQALRAVARGLPGLRDDTFDLANLGSPRGWEARALGAGGRLAYRLAFLLTDDLVRGRGFESLLAYFRASVDSDDQRDHFHRVFGLSLQGFKHGALARIRAEVEARKPLLLAESPRNPPSLDTLDVVRLLDQLEENPWDSH